VTNQTNTLSENIIKEFKVNGAVFLPGIFSNWVSCLRKGVSAVMKAPSERERSYEKNKDTPGFFNDFCNWQRINELRDFVYNSNSGEVAAQLMCSRTARFFHDHILVKEPGSSTVTPWHQDQPYYPVAGFQSVSFWIPLDPVPRKRSIEFIKGSHTWGQFKPRRFDGTDLFPNDPRNHFPDIDELNCSPKFLGSEMRPGDAAAFNFNIFHRAPANSSKRRRRVISMRWVGDDAKFAVRLGRTSPDFSYLNYRDGEPFSAPEFPLVFGRKTTE